MVIRHPCFCSGLLCLKHINKKPLRLSAIIIDPILGPVFQYGYLVEVSEMLIYGFILKRQRFSGSWLPGVTIGSSPLCLLWNMLLKIKSFYSAAS